MGLFGTFYSWLAFGLLIGRIIWLAERQKDNFSRFYGYGVASIFFTHWVINIGMTIGLFPTVGIPLPFFSYGGSHYGASPYCCSSLSSWMANDRTLS